MKENDLVQIRSVPGTGRAKGYMTPIWRNVLIRRLGASAPKYVRVVKKQTAPVQVEDDTVLDIYSLNLYWNDQAQLERFTTSRPNVQQDLFRRWLARALNERVLGGGRSGITGIGGNIP